MLGASKNRPKGEKIAREKNNGGAKAWPFKSLGRGFFESIEGGERVGVIDTGGTGKAVQERLVGRSQNQVAAGKRDIGPVAAAGLKQPDFTKD